MNYWVCGSQKRGDDPARAPDLTVAVRATYDTSDQ